MNFDKSLCTVAETIARWAANKPDWPAIVCPNLELFSFRSLDKKIKEIGAKLRGCGIGAASRVGLVLPQGPEAALAGMALASCCISFPLSPTLTPSEFEFELDRANLDAVVLPKWIESPLLPIIHSCMIGLFSISKANRSLNEVDIDEIAKVPAERRRCGDPSPQSICVIQTSSGSTGIPKLILVSHANLADISNKLRTWFGLSPNDRCVSILPISSGFGFKTTIIAPLLTGGSVAIPRAQQPEDIRSWSSELEPTWFVATPTFLQAALDSFHSAGNGHFSHSLRFFASTSAYLAIATRSGLEAALGIPGLEFYGLREAGVVAANPAPPASRKIGSAGRVLPNDVAILGDDSKILSLGMTGNVAVRGLGVSPGYIEALLTGSDIAAPLGSQHEWLLTGDLGFIDRDGFLFVTGRSKDIINRGGDKISPYEVEKVLLEHPKVREAGAFGVPHPRLGENVAAAVVLHRGCQATSHDIQKFLHARLPHSKAPQHIFVVETIPKVAAGKIDRLQLSKSFAQLASRTGSPNTPLEHAMVMIWQKLLKREDIGTDENFFEAGGDSLLAVTLTLEIERHLGFKIDLESIFFSPSLRNLCRFLSDELPPEDGAKNAVVLPIKSGNTNKSLYFIHSGFEFSNITDFLASDIYSAFVTANNIDWLRDVMAAESVLGAIDRISDAYAQAIVFRQQAGPLYLAGHSFGGVVAIETAAKLQEHGIAPTFVFLLDTYLHRAPHRIFYNTLYNGWLSKKLKDALLGNKRELARRARFISASVVSQLGGSSPFSKSSANSADNLASILRDFRERGTEAYRGPSCTLESKIVLFRATRASNGRILRIDPHPGWASDLGGNLTVVPVATDHFGIVGTGGRDMAYRINQLVQ